MVAQRRRKLATARKAAGYTQEALAEALHVDRSTVQRWEAGDHAPWPYLWPKLARLLGINKERLQELLVDDYPQPLTDKGHSPPPRAAHGAIANQAAAGGTSAGRVEVGDSLEQIGLNVEPVEFLARTMVETPVPGRIGWSDVEHVRATTQAVATAENIFGGGLSCEAAMGQLRWAGNLLEARADNDIRRAMLEAVGNLGSVVAFSVFDISDYAAADRCFQFSLWCADQSGSWALRANTLAEMSRKAAYLGNLDDALSLIEFAQVRADRVSDTARAMMWTIRAGLLALTGRHAEAKSDIDRADTYFHGRDPAADPPWLTYYDLAEHQGSVGKALIPIARAQKRVELAAPRLQSAIQLHRENYPRSRTFSRTRLATLMMDVGDPHEAVSIGRQAVDEAAPLRSDRIKKELGNLADVSRQHVRISDVGDLQHDIVKLTRLEA